MTGNNLTMLNEEIPLRYNHYLIYLQTKKENSWSV